MWVFGATPSFPLGNHIFRTLFQTSHGKTVIPRRGYQGFFFSRSGLISNTFMIDEIILEKTLEFVPGEWLLSSDLATGTANVPIFMKADNAEDEVKRT
jgi:hypothetical protein